MTRRAAAENAGQVQTLVPSAVDRDIIAGLCIAHDVPMAIDEPAVIWQAAAP